MFFRIILYSLVLLNTAQAEINPFVDFDDLLPENTEILKYRAGIKDTNNWYLAQSRTGRFRIHFPTPYEEWTIQSPQEVHALSAVTTEGLKLLIMEFDREKNKATKTPKALANVLFNQKEIVSNRSVSYKGYRGTEIKIRKASSFIIYRFIFTKTHIYQLSIEHPITQTKLAKKVIPFFLDSLKFSHYLN